MTLIYSASRDLRVFVLEMCFLLNLCVIIDKISFGVFMSHITNLDNQYSYQGKNFVVCLQKS